MSREARESDAEFFKQRGFGMRMGFGERSALLVIDMVKAFTNPQMMLGAVAAHEQSLFDLQAKYADVVSLDEALQYLRSLNPVGKPSKPACGLTAIAVNQPRSRQWLYSAATVLHDAARKRRQRPRTNKRSLATGTC